MVRLIAYLKPYWKVATVAPLLMFIEVAMDLYQPLLIARVIDIGVVQGDINYIVRTGLLMIGVAFLGMLGGLGCTVASTSASENFGAALRSGLFAKIQTFSFGNLDTFQTSSLITRLTNDVTQVQTVVLMGLRIMVRAPLLCIGGIIMAISINPRLSMILLVTVPIMAACVIWIIRKGFPMFSVVQKKLDRVNEVMRENLAGVRVVKAFVRRDREELRFATANTDLMAITCKALRLVFVTMPVVMLAMNFSIIAVLWFGGLQVQAGSMQVGEIMAFINYMTHILMSLMMAAFMLMMITRAKASADRIDEVLATEVDIKDDANASPSTISEGRVVFDDVSFRYYGSDSELVLKNVSFTAYPGETVALLGGTGSGKSTLVSLIMRLYDPTAGRVLIDGRDIRQFTLHSLRSQISIVLQESILFSDTIAANIRWGNEDAPIEDVQAAARLAQAHQFVTEFPKAYETSLGQRAVNISGGQKQRLAIARALIRKAPILILDDSTSAVDMGTEARIQQALNQQEKVTTFVIAQRISSVMDADRILVLDKGRIVAEGTHEALLESSAVYQEIYRSQMGEERMAHG